MKVPDYLEKTYWWAYVRPWAVQFFEREWLVDLILWGNYKKLRDAALHIFGDHLPGRTLQVACVYGTLTSRLYPKIEASGGTLDVVDVVTAQLDNLASKLPNLNKAKLLHMDSTDLAIADHTYDRTLIFFLVHEQPRAARERTLAEAWRVTKSGGDILILDFAKPKWWNPLRYLWLPFLGILEPFAPDIWKHEDVSAWLPANFVARIIQRNKYFGSLYQTLLVRKP